MNRRVYIAAFILVLLVAAVGGVLGARLLLQRLQGDLTGASDARWTPVAAGTQPADVSVPVSPVVVETQVSVASATPVVAESPTRRPTATVLVVAAPEGTNVLSPNEPSTAAPPPTIERATPEASPIATVVETSPPTVLSSAFPFLLAHPVRYSNGDCPGTYALGQVTDRGGKPQPNVRLYLVDEYGNGQYVVTKSGQGDAGRYDFPMFGPPRRFYMAVVDDAGKALSERVEILHEMPPQQNRPCRWVDWRRR